MSEIKTIVFSKRAILRLKNIADFIYKKSLSNEITLNYINRLKAYISSMLLSFPESGRKADEFGKDVRKLVYQGYSILYKINLDKERIEILTIYRENLP